MKRPQVYIIGAGPAGCATAIALARACADAVDITLLDGPRRPGPAIGETLPPAAAATLRAQGLAQLLDDPPHLRCPGSHSLWGSDTAGFNDFFLTPVGAGYHLDRVRFDADLLAAAAQLGATTVADSRLMGIERHGAQIELAVQSPAGRTQRRADFVVDASGIQARAARGLGVVRNEYDCVVSACAFFTLPKAPELPAHTLICAAPEGWWYATRLPGSRALVSLCTDADVIKRQRLDQPGCWHRALCSNDWLLSRCVEQFGIAPQQPRELWLRAAPSAILSCVTGTGWLAVGDAAASYDSLTSAGISKALAQGERAGEAIAERLGGGGDAALAEYQSGVFAEFSDYLRLHQRLYGAETRFADQPFWRRRMVA